MTSLSYLRYDVFTATAFAGNPLAVVIDPPPLRTDQMQTVAQEFNLSETVFITARDAEPNAFDVRIFTPGAELPFAGHPTVGAAIALADAGRVTGSVVLHETVGPVSVELVNGVATLTTPAAPRHVEVADPGEIVAALDLTFSDLHPDFGPSGWSAGVPFTILTVRDLDTLSQLAVNPSAWSTGVALSAAPEIYVLCPLDGANGRDWRARMFAPSLGITEDPATGSAAAATAGYLAGRVTESRRSEGWRIHQGVEMGRPSTIELGLVLVGNELVGARVGGQAAAVGAGTIRMPD